ncbi:hypothetical protein [Sphingomonas sp. RB1R13]|uniref:hypothetical protein n=1 Tax=Sphingomonas sp. RB1R13 TaxID=3096159 RepID=UPI002FC60187
MSDGPIWFAPKRYGYGAGLPIAWQGWLVMALFMAVTIAAAILFADRPLVLAAVLVPAVILLVILCARTTRGGWRWRWGGED